MTSQRLAAAACGGIFSNGELKLSIKVIAPRPARFAVVLTCRLEALSLAQPQTPRPELLHRSLALTDVPIAANQAPQRVRGGAPSPAASKAQPTYWLGRKTATEWIYDIRLPADLSAMLTCGAPQYARFKDVCHSTTVAKDGRNLSIFETSVAWNKDMIDNGQIAFRRNGAVRGDSWFSLDTNNPEWKAVTPQLKALATSNRTWSYVDASVLVSPDSAKPSVSLPISPWRFRHKTRWSLSASRPRPASSFPPYRSHRISTVSARKC